VAHAVIPPSSRRPSRPRQRLEMFVPLVAHDLKGPLRRLERLALEAQDRTGPDDGRLGNLVSQARRARCLVDDLLTWCRLSEDREEREDREAIALEPFITAIWEETPKPAGFRLALDCRVDELFANPAALGIVLRNLLENAILHHDRLDGVVAVRVWRVRQRLKLRIRDDGPGMRPAEAAAMAAVLADPEGAPAQARLGLRLVAEALHHLDGRARVRLPLRGRGTIVEISLPASS